MSTVKKGNKELTVDSTQVAAYVKDGFDEIDESGKVINESPAKTYSLADIMALKKEYDAKLAENAKTILKLTVEVEKLKKKIAGKGDDGAEATQIPEETTQTTKEK